MKLSRGAFYCVLANLIFSISAFSQQGGGTGQFEITLYSGGTFDLPGAAASAGLVRRSSTGAITRQENQFNNGYKSLPLVGGTLGFSLRRWLWISADYSYIFPNRNSAEVVFSDTGSSNKVTVDRHYSLASGKIQLTYPTVTRVVPYIELGVGSMHESYTSTRTLVNTGTSSPPPEAVSRDLVAPQFGGGVRIYVKEHSGFRFAAEGYILNRGIKQQVPGPQDTFPFILRRGWGRITGGYFFQFGG